MTTTCECHGVKNCPAAHPPSQAPRAETPVVFAPQTEREVWAALAKVTQA